MLERIDATAGEVRSVNEIPFAMRLRNRLLAKKRRVVGAGSGWDGNCYTRACGVLARLSLVCGVWQEGEELPPLEAERARREHKRNSFQRGHEALRPPGGAGAGWRSWRAPWRSSARCALPSAPRQPLSQRSAGPRRLGSRTGLAERCRSLLAGFAFLVIVGAIQRRRQCLTCLVPPGSLRRCFARKGKETKTPLFIEVSGSAHPKGKQTKQRQKKKTPNPQPPTQNNQTKEQKQNPKSARKPNKNQLKPKPHQKNQTNSNRKNHHTHKTQEKLPKPTTNRNNKTPNNNDKKPKPNFALLW